MSDLPKYQRIPSEGHELLPTELRSDFERDSPAGDASPTVGEDASTYPPPSPHEPASRGKQRVELHFVPRWPCKGGKEIVTCMLGKTRHVRTLKLFVFLLNPIGAGTEMGGRRLWTLSGTPSPLCETSLPSVWNSCSSQAVEAGKESCQMCGTTSWMTLRRR